MNDAPSDTPLSNDEILKQEFQQRVQFGDAALVDQWLNAHSQWGERINLPLFAFDGRAINVAARNRPMLEVLLKHDADINLKSAWWAGGFGALEAAPTEIADWLITCGATVDIFAAAKHGWFDRAKELIASDPSLVHAKGGDGQRPLHYASTREIIDFLLDHGADIDARCVDHASTAAQWEIKHPWKPRYLLDRGAGVDIFMAAYLDDVALIERALAEVPDSISARIGRPGYPRCPQEAAGSIHQWTLGFNLSAIEVAGRYGRANALGALNRLSGPRDRFLAACLMADETSAREILSKHSDLMSSLSSDDLSALRHAVRDSNLAAAQLMLILGFPINRREEGEEGFIPLDHAALRGNADMVKLLIERGADVHSINGYGSNPLGVCLWGSLNFKDPAGDYPKTAQLLRNAGSALPKTAFGSPACQAALRAK